LTLRCFILCFSFIGGNILNNDLNASNKKDSLNLAKTKVGIGTSLSSLVIADSKYSEIKSYYHIAERLQLNADFGIHIKNNKIEIGWYHVNSKGYFYQLGISYVLPINKRWRSNTSIGFLQNNYSFSMLKSLHSNLYSYTINGSMLHLTPSIDFKINNYFHIQGGLRIPFYRHIKHQFPNFKSEQNFDYSLDTYPIMKLHSSQFHNLIQLSLFYQFNY